MITGLMITGHSRSLQFCSSVSKMTFPHQFHRVSCHVMVFISTLGHRESLGFASFWRHELNFFEPKNVLLFEIKTFRNPSGTSSDFVW